MIQNSFLFFSGITEQEEREIWSQGIQTWDDLEKNLEILKVLFPKGYPSDDLVKRELDALRKELANQNLFYFWDRVPYLESWRLFGDFAEKFWGLDIETTGLGKNHKVTCICVSNGKETYQFTRTKNLYDFYDFWKNHTYAILVTYNGFRFDLPFLKRDLDWSCPFPHIDLMHLLHKMNIKGGLKGTELQLGIQREKNIQGMTGNHAVQLWNHYVETDLEEPLELLQQYNRADTENLIRIFEILYKTKRKKIFPEEQNLFL